MVASSSRPKPKLAASASASVNFIPEYDVFKRLKVVEDFLKEDELLEVCLSPGCRSSALGAISKLRTHISNTLHHHFDLD
jgi:2-succinyl-5-enolpyruvyl-6-hydroxy-3-cyclohexene-1-carboxylate synthase